MAKFCENCGTQLDLGDTTCPNCGAEIKVESAQYEKSEPQASDNRGGFEQSYGSPNNGNGQGYNGGYNQYQRPYQTPPYNQYNNPYSNPYANQYNNGQGGYPNGYYMPPKQRTMSVGLLIFSIINILFGCGGLVMILGIIALVMTVQAKNAATDEEEASKKKTALILNIASIVLCVFVFIFAFMIGMLEVLMYM